MVPAFELGVLSVKSGLSTWLLFMEELAVEVVSSLKVEYVSLFGLIPELKSESESESELELELELETIAEPEFSSLPESISESEFNSAAESKSEVDSLAEFKLLFNFEFILDFFGLERWL